MAEAKRPADKAEWVAKTDDRRKTRRQSRKLKDKTFEQLSPKEKDRLLKMVAIKLGLIAASDDVEGP